MGDEFVAAGGFDRLSGNNKAISVCERSQKDGEGEEETTHGGHTHTHNQEQINHNFFFSPKGGVMRRFN